MNFRTLIGLLTVIIVYSFCKQASKSGLQVEHSQNQNLSSQNGLRIDNGINRGMKVTDTTAITYIPVTFTNDSTVSIHLQIAFLKDYDHPHPESDDKFNVVLLPKEWTESKPVSNRMINKLKNYVDKPFLNETIRPGEKITIAIGTLRPAPSKICGIIPNVLFQYSNRVLYSACDSLINSDVSTSSQFELGIKLDFCHTAGVAESCFIIPCGQISYLED